MSGLKLEIVLIYSLGLILTSLFIFPSMNYYLGRVDLEVNSYTAWYVSDSLLSGKIFNKDEFYDTGQFYPFPGSLAQVEMMLVPSLFLYAPAYILTGNHIVATEFLTVTAFVLNFISSYFSLKFFSKTKIAALAGAIIFTFSPPVMTRFFNGHLEYLSLFFIPPALVFFLKFIEKPSLKSSLAFGLLLVLNLLTNIQLTVFLMILLIIMFMIRLPFSGKNMHYMTKIFSSLPPVFILLLPVFLLYSPYLKYLRAEKIQRSLSETAHNSSRISDYVYGIPQNWLLGNVYKSISSVRSPQELRGSFNFAEHTQFPGFLFTFLLFVYLFQWRKPGKNRYIFKILAATGFMAILLSLGPFWDGNGFRLPYYYLQQLLPFLASSRTPGRIFLAGVLMLIIPAIQVIDNYFRKPAGSHKKIVMFLIFFLLLAEYWNKPYTFSRRTSSKINFDLQGKKVLFLPFPPKGNDGYTAKYLSFIPQNRFRMVNGYTGFETQKYTRLKQELSADLFSDNWQAKVRELGLDYLIVDRELNEDRDNIYYISGDLLNMLDEPVYQDNRWQVISLNEQG
ncbi:MAG: hypothetical protein UV73_C0002G0153 [Candidatus Gottesmanbacteria bacterium GW2011_GWA2_43_14]|uniref:Glycosyltransferase RgtA/B/C/D-like domain-containing protein n=1 Tax=Candidatus Gottesmanbacteria bacterium GW2011_GWA2_43_14 TaxID=1618443 RepID=A0A0G1DL99_9BACT|nr:MAG: hypothetical protein UV73_C0002G0153 [Candidatus Gottesmanbacteria bacterium GW2011_GWA2_43_14]